MDLREEQIRIPLHKEQWIILEEKKKAFRWETTKIRKDGIGLLLNTREKSVR